MRIPSGKTDQLIFFVAVDSTDLKTRKTGLSSFTVYRSRNGGTATVYTTPTVAELSAGNMPGVYSLTIDEDTTIASTSDSEEYCVHITQASMAPVTRTIELYRRDTTTGNTALVDSNGRVDVIKIAGTTQTARDIGASVLLASGQKVDVDTIKTNPVVNAGTITFPTGATLASTTNITAGTIATVTTVTGLTASNLDATISSRMATFTLPTNFSSLVIDSSGRVNAFLIGILTSVFTEGATGRIAAAFKQFFNIASPAATMDHGVLIDTVTTATTATNLTNAATAGDLTATMKTSVTTAATAATPTVTTGTLSNNVITAASINAAALNGKGDWNIGKTGYALSADGVQAIWDALTSALTTAGSIGKLLVDNVNASISAIKTVTDKFAFTVANQVDANVITKTGFALTSAYDPAKTASQAGDAMALTSGERNSTADAILTRSMTESYAAKNAALTPAQALYAINQQIGEQGIVGTTMTVKKRDQSTTAKTYTLNDATTPTAITEAS